MKRLLLLLLALASPAAAWEADSTHAGLTENAALSAKLHAALASAHGRTLGLYESLTVGKPDAPALYAKLALLAPTGGFVPDGKGRQTALSWLVAGAVIADVPADAGTHHFQSAAVDWISAPGNDMSLARFASELFASASARTRAERDEHLALALLCAGALVHVVQDMGSPSRAHGDLSDHMSALGDGRADRGSRFEHLATLLYGRVGLPPSVAAVVHVHAREFVADLAGRVASRWLSSTRLPRLTRVPPHATFGDIRQAIERSWPVAAPRPRGTIDLEAASPSDGALLQDEQGLCLARVRLDGERMTFAPDDKCTAEQLATILPEVAGYSTGFLDWLFRGTLRVERGAVVTERKLGAGSLWLFAEDKNGNRAAMSTRTITAALAGDELAQVATPPPGTTKIVAVFRGADDATEEIVAVGEAAWSK